MSLQVDSSQVRAALVPKTPVMKLKMQLAHFLKERGWTAAELSRRSGVSKQVLSSWLSGSSPKNLGNIKQVASVLEVTVDQLLFGDTENSVEIRIPERQTLGNDWISGVYEVRLRRVK